MTAYVAGSVGAGAGLGGALGAIGLPFAAVLPVGTRGLLFALAAAIAIGAAFDGGLVGRALPSVRRQVDERWMGEYRGWVYGLGFGLQLGAGVVTIVTVSAVYATFLSAFLSGSATAGALIGGAFGLARSAAVLSVAGVHTSAQLLAVDGRLARWDRPARRLTILAESALAAAALIAAARV